MAPFRTTLQLADDGGSTAPATFKPVKTIVDIYGESVPVDASGRNAQGEIVIAGESDKDTAARRAANLGMGLSPSGNQLSGRTITRNAAVRTVGGVKVYTKEVVDPETGEVLRTFEETESPGVSAQAGAGGAGTSEQENAIEILKRTFANYGLESLAGRITELVRKGYRGDTVSLMLQETPEYKQRFVANEARKKAGLPVLSPAEYLATEASYRRAMQMSGLPSGYYDSNEDYAKLIANDVSPTELNARLDAAKGAIANADPLYVDQLKKYYNMTTGQLIAYALDPQTALPILERQAAAVGLGVAAAQQGITADAQTAEYYAGLGIGEQQARAGFAGISRTLPTYEKLGAIYGNMPQDSTKSLMAATFGGQGQAAEQQRLEELARKERGMFSGSSGASQAALSGGTEAGML